MVAIHYLGDYSLAVRLLEPVHAIDKNNISTAEMLYLAYFCQVDCKNAPQLHYSASLTKCVICRTK